MSYSRGAHGKTTWNGEMRMCEVGIAGNIKGMHSVVMKRNAKG